MQVRLQKKGKSCARLLNFKHYHNFLKEIFYAPEVQYIEDTVMQAILEKFRISHIMWNSLFIFIFLCKVHTYCQFCFCFRNQSFTYIEILFTTTSAENNQYTVKYRPVDKEGKNENHNICGIKFRSELIIKMNDQICLVAGKPKGQNFYPATITILGTDYNNYGLYYMCDHDQNNSRK